MFRGSVIGGFGRDNGEDSFVVVVVVVICMLCGDWYVGSLWGGELGKFNDVVGFFKYIMVVL